VGDLDTARAKEHLGSDLNAAHLGRDLDMMLTSNTEDLDGSLMRCGRAARSTTAEAA
jgi:hypothetical protein